MPVRRGKDGRWRYREVVALPNGTRTRISGSAPRYSNTKVAAQQALLEHVDRLLHPERHNPLQRKEAPRFDAFAVEFFENYVKVNNKRSEIDTKRSTLNRHLIPTFGDMTLDEITTRQIEAYKADKLSGRSNGGRTLRWNSINNHLFILRRMLVIAKKWGLLDDLPEFQLLRGPKPEFDFLDFDEAERLVRAADTNARVMILCALKTGMRIGELIALRWGDVDLDAGHLMVRRSYYRGTIGAPKSGKDRKIPISRALESALRAHRHDRSEIVFCDPDRGGDYLRNNRVYAPLAKAYKAAGLRHIGWHVLRHTFASHLVMRGVPLKVVQELLGHATIQMTMRYSHLSPSLHRDAVDALDRDPTDRDPTPGPGAHP